MGHETPQRFSALPPFPRAIIPSSSANAYPRGFLRARLVRVEKAMPEQSAGPMPPELREGFSQAVWSYNDWNPGEPEREFQIGQAFFTMTSTCGLVAQFTDPLPERDLHQLHAYMHDDMHGDLITKLFANPSYAIGAQCLRTMIERANEKWRRNR